MSGNPYSMPQLSQNDNTPFWNPWHHDGPLPSRRIAFVPTNDSVAYGNMAMRPHYYYSSSFSSEYQNYRTANQGALHNGYTRFSSPGASYLPGAGHGYPTMAFQMDNRSVSLKRKRMDTGGYHAGSLSNISVSTDRLQNNHIQAPAFRPPPVPFTIAPPNWNGNLTSTGEGSLRHVRSRLSHAFPSESAPLTTYSSSNTHPFFYTSSNTALSVPEQWRNGPTSVSSQLRILHTGGNPSSNTAIPRDRDPIAPLTTLHSPPEGTVPAPDSFPHRVAPHEGIPSYRHVASAATSVSAGLPYVPGAAASFRHARHGMVGHGSSRGRTRTARSSYDGVHSLVVSETARNRWASERFVLIDPSFYDSRELFDPHWDRWIYNSRELFDSHWEMRLDIDNMSYEELLDLEERIGNVGTGLPDETISSCLTEIACCLSNKTQGDGEEGNCTICLEEYRDGNKLGRLSCGHDFHGECIKKWLQVKNFCPVCKAAASEDTTSRSKMIPS